MVHKIFQKNLRLKDGGTLSIFFNPENNLLVVDKIRKDELGGNEFIRMNVGKVIVPSKKEIMSRKV
jgi:hypothetical protein